MASITINLDRDLEARVKRYADGVGVPLEEVVEKALVFALRSRYPSNELPDDEGPVDPGYGKPDIGGRPDQGLPPSGGRPDQELPETPSTKPGSPVNGRCPIFDPTVDNELPDSEVPPEVDQELPETPEPK